MLRNIAGIMADEEPKTAISPSGLYNSLQTNDLGLLTTSLSSSVISDLSEFTMMSWFYIDLASGNGAFTPYRDVSSVGNSFPFIFGVGVQNQLKADLKNSNSGSTVVQDTTTTIPYQEWFHVCITGSVSNGRIRMYYNSALTKEAVMTYSNATSISNSFVGNTSLDMAQFNVYNVELTEEEVAEHYVYDDDTMLSGVLGWDAMTPEQRSGLIYSSSYTDDISISGNEFHDKSGSGITISPKPSLTGEQIYFYTDASDLPNSTTIYNVNSATMNGTSQWFSAGTKYDIGSGEFGFSTWVKFDDLSESKFIFGRYVNAVGYASYYFFYDPNVSTLAFDVSTNNNNVTNTYGFSWSANIDQWYHLVTCREGNTYKLYIDGVLVSTQTMNVTVSTSPTTFEWGALGQLAVSGSKSQSFVNNVIGDHYTQTDVDELYNSGTPLCYNKLIQPLKDKITSFSYLCNWTGNTGQETIDQTGNGNNLTPVNSPTYTNQGLTVECTPPTTQIYNVNSATFGTAYYNISSTSTELEAGIVATNKVVWAFRFKGSSAGTEFMFHNGDATNNNNNVGIYFTSGQIRAEIDKDNTNTIRKITQSTYNDNSWHTCALYWDSSTTLQIFIDGVSVSLNDAGTNGTTDVVNTATDNFTFGRRATSSALPFTGTLAFGRMFKGTFAPSDFVDYHNGEVALCDEDLPTAWANSVVGSWRMSNWGANAGEETDDKSGNGNNLTAFGSPTYTDQGLQVECTS